MRLAELEEEGVRVALTVVDTPGFGDNIDNERWYVVHTPFPSPYLLSCGDQRFLFCSPLSFSEILNYIELQYDHILAEESRIKRERRLSPSFLESSLAHT